MRRPASILAASLLVTAMLIAGTALAEGHGTEGAGGHDEGGHGEVTPSRQSSAHSAGGGERGEHGGAINWWKADLHAPPVGWLIVDFAILVGALYFVLRKPLAIFLVNRRQTLKAQIDEAARVKAEIDAKHADLLARLAAIDQTVKDITASFAGRGEDERKRLVETAEHLRAAIEQSARETIAREVTAAKDCIRAEVARSAATVAEELLRKHLRPEDNERFVREFVERLATMKTDGLQ